MAGGLAIAAAQGVAGVPVVLIILTLLHSAGVAAVFETSIRRAARI
jgi:hypothetical protein